MAYKVYPQVNPETKAQKGFSIHEESGKCILEVYEAFNGFYIHHTPTAQTKGMGDGVDMIFDENDNVVNPGDERFWDLFTQDISGDVPAVLEAYFGIEES